MVSPTPTPPRSSPPALKPISYPFSLSLENQKHVKKTIKCNKIK